MIQKIIILDDYRDRCSVYSVLCMRSYTFYNRLKILFQLPIILLSSVLSILNGNMESVNKDAMNIVNISINALTAILLVVQNNLKFESRAMHFKQVSTSFTKLERDIEKYMIANHTEDDISEEFAKGVMTSYDTIVENLQFDIPSSICNSVRTLYAGKKTLPLLINGIKKEEKYRQEILCESNIVYVDAC